MELFIRMDIPKKAFPELIQGADEATKVKVIIIKEDK